MPYVYIPDETVSTGQPVSQETMRALRDNPLALFVDGGEASPIGVLDIITPIYTRTTPNTPNRLTADNFLYDKPANYGKTLFITMPKTFIRGQRTNLEGSAFVDISLNYEETATQFRLINHAANSDTGQVYNLRTTSFFDFGITVFYIKQ